MIFSTLIASAPYVGFIILLILSGWFFAIKSLGRQFNLLTQPSPKASDTTTSPSEPALANAPVNAHGEQSPEGKVIESPAAT
jgi:hypothetical protein